MKKIADAIFEPDETSTVTHLVDHNSKATLRQVRSYWSDNDIPRLSGVSETDIATLPSDELQKRVVEFWGTDISNRADQFAKRFSQETNPNYCREAVGSGVSSMKLLAAAACLVAAIFVGFTFMQDQGGNPVMVELDDHLGIEPSVTPETLEQDEVRLAEVPPLEVVNPWPTYAPVLQSDDAAMLSTVSTSGEDAWMVDLDFKGERYQIVSITLGGEFTNPYLALEDLGYDGNVRDAFSSRLVSAEDIDPRRLPIGGRFLAVLQIRNNYDVPSFISLSYFPARQTAALSQETATCGTGNTTFSEAGLILAAFEMQANVVSRAVTNCSLPLEIAANATLEAGE